MSIKVIPYILKMRKLHKCKAIGATREASFWYRLQTSFVFLILLSIPLVIAGRALAALTTGFFALATIATISMKLMTHGQRERDLNTSFSQTGYFQNSLFRLINQSRQLKEHSIISDGDYAVTHLRKSQSELGT